MRKTFEHFTSTTSDMASLAFLNDLQRQPSVRIFADAEKEKKI